MKVADLFETDEYDNQPETLDYLSRKQKSACHHYNIEVINLIKLNPDDRTLKRWVMSPRLSSPETISAQNLWSLSEMVPQWTSLLDKYQSLKIKVDKLIKAKEAFEKAGGKYK